MRYLYTMIAVAALLLLGTIPATAAEEPVVFTNEIVSTPDNDPPGTAECDAWARDTFTRTTTLTPNGDGFDVLLQAEGTFLAESGITGSLSGFVEYTVTGEIDAEAVSELDGQSFDYSGVACKGDASDLPSASEWALQFFVEGATATSISAWSYTYDTGCESFTETTGTEAVGADTFAGIGCPGEDGEDGQDGTDGTDGQDGVDGADGTDGKDADDAKDDTGTDTDPKPVPTAVPAGAELPKTGISPLMLTGGGIALLLAGGALLLARRQTS